MSARSEHGVLSTEVALLMPVLVIVALIAVFAGQVQSHGARTRSAADAAARTAAVHGASSARAESAATAAANRECRGDVSQVVFDWVEPNAAELRPGYVRIALTCTESYGGIAALFGGDDRAQRSVAVSVIEYWRAT